MRIEQRSENDCTFKVSWFPEAEYYDEGKRKDYIVQAWYKVEGRYPTSDWIKLCKGTGSWEEALEAFGQANKHELRAVVENLPVVYPAESKEEDRVITISVTPDQALLLSQGIGSIWSRAEDDLRTSIASGSDGEHVKAQLAQVKELKALIGDAYDTVMVPLEAQKTASIGQASTPFALSPQTPSKPSTQVDATFPQMLKE